MSVRNGSGEIVIRCLCPERTYDRPRHAMMSGVRASSRNEIRSRKASLRFFQPLQLQPVIRAHRRQCVNGRVQIAMLLPQTLGFAGEFGPLFFA